MNIVVLGATGFVGGNVSRHLVADGHHVTGLARSDEAGALLESRGITPLPGNLDERRDEVVKAAAGADAVVFAAQMDARGETESVGALLDALAGSGKAFLFTSGSGVHLQRTAGAWSEDCFAEDEPFTVEPLAADRLAVERLVRDAAQRQVRAMVIRPGLIWGPGDHGHVSMVYGSVARTGAACYVGEGLNTYSNVHIDDAARLFVTALHQGSAGALYHAVAGEIPNRWIAEAVARDLDCGTRSLTEHEAAAVWGDFGALIMAASSRGRAPRTRQDLGWAPHHTDMLTMIGEPRLRELANR
ncbi:nucleoside-diphosphate-sugar epimerase [Streptomyces aurantiacus]|uniref:NAD-dependent epimerase/dehydratase family protein n=1 Tax=Streptomyces aurantiacus TaxID=47760 RepID=UPI00279244DA|nr:NAD-dependent epimerase/dehydratase family protein [Streptomyces aurantiacus]MDQ0779634.1 nucleoside-diphosphate-sugar epimerase [Streptomyces aurantiacus]